MAAVTELEIYAAAKAGVVAASGWFTGKTIYFARRPPNGVNQPYVLMACEEAEEADDDYESDGNISQKFFLEIMARSTGPVDAEAMNAAITALDPKWTDAANGGYALANTDRGIVGIVPRAGKLRLIEPLRDGGQDQYTAQRRWEVHTAALIGA